MSHKYRVDTITFYHDGSRENGSYFTNSISSLIRAFEQDPRSAGYERHGRQFDTYTGYSHTAHFITRLY